MVGTGHSPIRRETVKEKGDTYVLTGACLLGVSHHLIYRYPTPPQIRTRNGLDL